jgi:hypothetical protein
MLIAQATIPMAMAPAKAVNEIDKVDMNPVQKAGRVSPITRKFKLNSIRRPMIEGIGV